MNPEVRTLSFWNLKTEEEKEGKKKKKKDGGKQENADQDLPD